MYNTYKLRQILFALRKEYIEVERKLRELEKYVNVIDDIDDISFKIHDFNDSKNIDMYLTKKQTIIDKIREVIGLPGIYTRGVAFWMVPEEIDAAYYWKKDKVCSITDLDDFSKSINEILESDFVKNVKANITSKKEDFLLKNNAGGINLVKKENNFVPVSYSSDDRCINIKRNESRITSNYINALFNIEFKKDNFNDYYRDIIDGYEDKEIKVINDFSSNYADIEVIEEPKKLILRPKKDQ